MAIPRSSWGLPGHKGSMVQARKGLCQGQALSPLGSSLCHTPTGGVPDLIPPQSSPAEQNPSCAAGRGLPARDKMGLTSGTHLPWARPSSPAVPLGGQSGRHSRVQPPGLFPSRPGCWCLPPERMCKFLQLSWWICNVQVGAAPTTQPAGGSCSLASWEP